MLETSTRVLRLLSLLQARREWSGAELSERLEVDVRTIRRDMNRLRDLGYVVSASAGPGGGYRLGAGSNTPPLLLDDSEAVAVAVAMSAAASSVGDLQGIALRVLVKLDQLLPQRLRKRLNALQSMIVALPGGEQPVEPGLLATLAAACRDQEVLTFRYRSGRGELTRREVEPMRLAHTGRVWYLAAWDIGRADWRTFRIDRIDRSAAIDTGARFTPRQPPEDFATYVSRSIAESPYRYRARLAVDESAASVSARVPSWVGVVESSGPASCVLSIGAESYEALAALIINAGVDFRLLEPQELAEPLRAVAARLAAGCS